MKSFSTHIKYGLFAAALLLAGGCLKESGPESGSSDLETFSGTLLSTATKRPLSDVRVRVLLVQNGEYVAPKNDVGTTYTNEKGQFIVYVLQTDQELMPLEFSKESVIETDTVIVRRTGLPISDQYQWGSGPGELVITLRAYPWLMDEGGNPIISGE